MVENSDFKNKSVFDIGCGNGKYLKYLQSLGFKTNGIDSSATAVEMTKKVLGDDSGITVDSMFDCELSGDKFDLIISVSTIHHGTKKQISDLVDKIFKSLLGGGKVFITLPDLDSAKNDDDFNNSEEIESGTFAPLSGPEKGLPHSYYIKEEIENLFSKFGNLKIELDDIGRWVVVGYR